MLRLYLPSDCRRGPQLSITGAALRHLRVLRLRPGDPLVAFDERGEEHEAIIECVGGRIAEARIVHSHRPEREPRLELTLAQALIRAPKMDWVVEKATELGVQRILPFVSAYTRQQGGARAERWRRLAAAAAQQSGRTRVPDIAEPADLHTVLGTAHGDLRLLCWERERRETLGGTSGGPGNPASVVVFVGPEGGFAEHEVEAARRAGVRPVALAPRVLRAETAAIAAVALCLQRWGDLG